MTRIDRRGLLTGAAATAALAGCATRVTPARSPAPSDEPGLLSDMVVLKRIARDTYALGAGDPTLPGAQRSAASRFAAIENQHLGELSRQLTNMGHGQPPVPAPLPGRGAARLHRLLDLELATAAAWVWMVPRAVSKELRAITTLLMPVEERQAATLSALVGRPLPDEAAVGALGPATVRARFAPPGPAAAPGSVGPR
ncbi:MAG TPA: twin-arginine translocation signal domain-containing protein [Solirubrobacteraceae bacterium]|jgi:hypothetical protein|nr:twin-arginine translocation signal domain-containing protein [Solirubrobacteraceae bacterium]